MTWRHAVLSVLAVGVLAAPASALPITWTANGQQYQVVVSDQLPWSDARTAAQKLGTGWDLATITSVEEQAFIAGILAPLPPANGPIVEYWVGGYQEPGATEPGYGWTWINGEGVFWNNGPTALYSAWGAGEPNNNPRPENHLALDNRYAWGWNDNDASLYAIHGFVAENPIPEPASLVLLGTGLVGLRAWRKRRA